jgi:hypothetical protein
MRQTKKHFHYKNHQVHHHGTNKTVKSVLIKNGKGYKSVSKYRNGKKLYSVKKRIHPVDMEKIRLCQFIPGLFGDCTKTRKIKAT